jgi:translocation and assembly module TamA
VHRNALALLAIAACATPSQPFEGHPVLLAIKFEGNKSIKEGDLLAHIATAPTSGFFGKTVRYYDADLFAIDLKRIVRWYNTKGFYEAKIDGDPVVLQDEDGRVAVVVRIDEGPRAVIRQIDLKGLDELDQDEIKDARNALPIRTGDGFDEEVYDKAKAVLTEQLKERGFAGAEVSGRVEIGTHDSSAHIFFDCDTGQRFRFGKVSVSGNRQIASDEIASATGIEKGQLYTPQAIALAQQRVYNLGTFSGVRVQLEPLGDAPVAAVRVNVHEAPFQTVRFGIGGAIESTRWELPRLRAEYTNRSLFGGLRRLELTSTTGYAVIPTPFAYDPQHSGITTQNVAQLTVPHVLLPGLDWISRAEFGREVQNGFTYDDIAGRTGFLYRRGNHSVLPSINFVHYFNVDLYGISVGQAIGSGGAAGIVKDCPVECTLTYPELRYSYDGRDNAIEPTLGFYFSITLAQTLKPGSFSYFRVNPELRLYFPFTKYTVVALRGQYGGLFTETADGASPFTQRFFLGGQNDQRGYAPLRQGPKLGACGPGPNGQVQTSCAYAAVSTPIGAKFATLFSAELRIHADFLFKNLMIVPFVDASRAQDDKNVLNGGLEFAPGIGLRYVTGFGPIRLDFGWVANPKDVYVPADGTVILNPTRVSAFCSKSDPTCIHEVRWAIHVTLGEAF